MSTDARLVFLIDKAVSVVGSEYKVAKLLKMSQANLSAAKAGRRRCTIHHRALLASIAGEDVQRELNEATIEQAPEPVREALRQVLGKASRATGGALHSLALGVSSLIYGLNVWSDLPLCIKRRTC
jgi:DNA-binding transcriptional regulator YdaS (Cro superfamily)